MFFKRIRLQLLALVKSIMSSPPPSDANFLFPENSNHLINVEIWRYLVETGHAVSDATTIKGIRHFKSTRDAHHEFLIVEMEYKTRTTYIITDRMPSPTNSSSPFPLTPPTSSKGSRSTLGPVNALDRVLVPRLGLEACLNTLVLELFADVNEVCALHWPNAEASHMTAAELSVILIAAHMSGGQYSANGNSCYWFAYNVMELIRTKFGVVQTEGPAFAERSKIAKMRMDIQHDVDTIGECYEAEWRKYSARVQLKRVSSVILCFVTAESDIS